MRYTKSISDRTNDLNDQNELYNFDDGLSQTSSEVYPTAKRARPSDCPQFPTAPLPSMSKRFNSFSNKWKARTGAGPKLSIDVAAPDPVRSRNGSAGSSMISPLVGAVSQQNSSLPSPARTVFEETAKEASLTPIDIERANSQAYEVEEAHSTTPLLPPLLMALAKERDVHSPLQSPKIADAGFFPESNSPSGTPRMNSLPSPPLSTKPSISSMRQRSRAGTMVGSPIITSTDLPPMIIDTDDEDDWSAKLGHADYTILPEPYLPGSLDIETCKKFRQAYKEARANYKKHLFRTAENSGIKSRVFKLTEEKWAEIDAEWQQYDAIVAEAVKRLTQAQDAATSGTIDSHCESIPLPQIPATDIVTGKFPILGDNDIVGPMAVAPALQKLISQENHIRIAKKRTFLKFLSDLLTRGNARA